MSNARFSITQAKAVRDSRVSHAQFRTLAALGMYADRDGWCYPSQTTVGTDVGKQRQTVNEDIAALVDFGYVEKHPTPNGMKYRLVFDPKGVSEPADIPQMGESELPDRGVGTAGQGVSELPDTNVPINVPKNEPKRKRKDILEPFLKMEAAKEKEMRAVEEVLVKLEQGLKVNISRSSANQVIAKKILKDGRPVEQWISWLYADDWRATHSYLWKNLSKVWEDYPQAFIEDKHSILEGV